MDENIYQIAEQIVQLHQKAYEVYLLLVEDVCSRKNQKERMELLRQLAVQQLRTLEKINLNNLPKLENETID